MNHKLCLNEMILLLLYVPGNTGCRSEPIRGWTRMAKMVFLFDMELRERFNSAKECTLPTGNVTILESSTLKIFEPHSFGPFSDQIFDSLKYFEHLGFVEGIEVDAEIALEESIECAHLMDEIYGHAAFCPAAKAVDYALSELGRELMHSHVMKLPSAAQLALVTEFKKRCNGTPLQLLLRYICERYPQMLIKSDIRDQSMAEYDDLSTARMA